ncbi:MAG TPA: histidine kinase [Chryseolinea sp.]|nr:histidine kinase [Chryseolinea sp.]
MIFRNLILSREKKYVVFRHLSFWIVYGTLFHIQNNVRSLLYIGCFLPACLVIVYSLLYAVLPLLQNKRYPLVVLVAVGAYISSLLLNFTGSFLFFRTWEDEVPNKMILGLALHNHIIALCMGAVALGLKATKSWYVKQTENLVLAKLKARNELMLEKSNLYPEFILQSLSSLQDRVDRGSGDAPDLLLKLSDTLSYILYDSQVELIELEKELGMVRNIVKFKAMHWSSCNIQFIITGISAERQVMPLVLFRMVENFFRVMSVEGDIPTEVDIRMNIDDDYLSFNAAIQYSPDRTNPLAFEDLITKMRKHLDDTYSDGCDAMKTGSGQYSVSVPLHLIKQRTQTNDIPSKENVLA